LIVSGSPDKFVRLWDPRLKGGNAQTHKLQGHSDAVRDVLVSEDGKWILSASSDTTIKLWSTAMPTTSYATYNYSESSLWCLATNSPTLSTFWAGARDGWVYKVNNKTSYDEDYSDAIVICKEEYPILRLAALEDEYIWTATSSSTINRWRDCPVGEDKSIIVPESCFCRPDEGSDDEGSSLPSKITSIHSGMDEKTRSEPILSAELVSGVQRDMHALWESPEHSIHGVPGIKKALLLNNKRHVITQDTKGNVSIWDIICCKKITDLGMIDFEQSCNTENTMEWLANWCTVDIKTGDLTIHLEEGKCYDCEMYYQDLNLPKEPANEDQRINLARWILTYLLHDHLRTLYPNNPSFCTEEKSPKKLLPLKVDGLSQFTALETPSMSVSLATPLTKFPSMQTPETNETSTTPLNTFVEENPLSPLNPSPIPMSPQASQESQEDPKKSVPVRNPSFIDKFKFRRGRTPSSKSQEESIPTVTTTPTRTTSFSAENVILVNEPPEAEEFINLDETPHIVLPPNLPICFSIEQSPSMYIDTFHGTVRGLGTLKNSDLIPPWVQDWIIQVS
jgi:WD repeat-containing protein 48